MVTTFMQLAPCSVRFLPYNHPAVIATGCQKTVVDWMWPCHLPDRAFVSVTYHQHHYVVMTSSTSLCCRDNIINITTFSSTSLHCHYNITNSTTLSWQLHQHHYFVTMTSPRALQLSYCFCDYQTTNGSVLEQTCITSTTAHLVKHQLCWAGHVHVRK